MATKPLQTIKFPGISDTFTFLQKDEVVRYDAAQSLTSAQKAQARENIGAGSGFEIDSAMSASSENPVQNKVIKAYADSTYSAAVNGKALAIYDDASGDIVTITDGANNMKLKSLIANITPIQSLNGYSSPWPDGGGKNIANVNNFAGSNGVTLSVTATETGSTVVGESTVDTTYRGISLEIPATGLVGSTLTFSGSQEVSGGGAGLNVQVRTILNEESTTQATDTNANFSMTVTIPECDTIRVYASITAETGVIGATKTIKNLQIELGSTATAYAPYSNICPITGWTGANVYRTGKNSGTLSESNKGGNRNATASYADGGAVVVSTGTYGRYGWLIPVKKGETYTVSFKAKKSVSTGYGRVLIGSQDEAWQSTSEGYLKQWQTDTTFADFSFTFTAPTNVMFFGLYPEQTEETACTMTVTNLQVELGTATAYAPYAGTVIPVSWQTEAGTVYCGRYDAVSGKLFVTHTVISFNGTENYWGTYSSNYVRCILGYSTYHVGGDVLSKSNMFSNGGDTYTPVNNAFGYKNDTSSLYLTFRMNGVTDTGSTTAFKSQLATWAANSTPLTVMLAYVTPQTVQLTANEIKTLLGQNTIWADCGSIASVNYPCDTKIYVDEKVTALTALLSEV